MTAPRTLVLALDPGVTTGLSAASMSDPRPVLVALTEPATTPRTAATYADLRAWLDAAEKAGQSVEGCLVTRDPKP